MKKHSNSAEKCKPSKKRAIPRIPVRRDAREVMADLVVQLTKQLDGKSLPVAEETKGGRDVVKPNLDRLRVGVDLGDEWSNYCILGLGGETLAEGQFRTRQQDLRNCFKAESGLDSTTFSLSQAAASKPQSLHCEALIGSL